jgi:hypothetical protein
MTSAWLLSYEFLLQTAKDFVPRLMTISIMEMIMVAALFVLAYCSLIALYRTISGFIRIMTFVTTFVILFWGVRMAAVVIYQYMGNGGLGRFQECFSKDFLDELFPQEEAWTEITLASLPYRLAGLVACLFASTIGTS